MEIRRTLLVKANEDTIFSLVTASSGDISLGIGTRVCQFCRDAEKPSIHVLTDCGALIYNRMGCLVILELFRYSRISFIDRPPSRTLIYYQSNDVSLNLRLVLSQHFQPLTSIHFTHSYFNSAVTLLVTVF